LNDRDGRHVASSVSRVAVRPSIAARARRSTPSASVRLLPVSPGRARARACVSTAVRSAVHGCVAACGSVRACVRACVRAQFYSTQIDEMPLNVADLI
jgi:hypothetical protein